MKHFDVIVIGSGIAGLNFALRAAEQKKSVLVVTKKNITDSSTNLAQGGIAAVLSKLDNHKKHIADTLVAGCFHNDKKAVRYMVENGAACVKRLVRFGVPFATKGGEMLLAREGGHSERRIAHVSDYTGKAIEEALVSHVRKNRLITLYENTFGNALLVKKGVCYGVQIFRDGTKDGTFENIYADSTILATGGLGQIFESTTNPTISTGDGIAMAKAAGCKFKDLEFIQFHPTALNLKGKKRDAIPKFLISEAVRGEGAYLINSKGERFMIRSHKLAELAPRDIVSRAIFEEEETGPVYLDISHKDANFIKTRFPQIYLTLKSNGLDITKSPIPISPVAHYSCGGVKVDLNGRTNIKNLFAFGEVACTGVQGANRLASNSLLEALVFSDRIIKNTAKKEGKIPEFETLEYKPLSTPELSKLQKIRETLKQIMWKRVGIVRTKKGLMEAKNVISKLETQIKRIKANDPRLTEVSNMITSAKLITSAALARKKSLGCHYRLD